jgi:hypothetical protein
LKRRLRLALGRAGDDAHLAGGCARSAGKAGVAGVKLKNPLAAFGGMPARGNGFDGGGVAVNADIERDGPLLAEDCPAAAPNGMRFQRERAPVKVFGT